MKSRLQPTNALLALLLLLSGCEGPASTEAPKERPAAAAGSTASAPPAAGKPTETTAQRADQPDCVRGAPVPILAEGGTKPTFEKMGDHEARERVALDERTDLTVRQFGCAHYAVEYSFLLKGEQSTPRSSGEWLKRAAELLGKVSVVPAQQNAVRKLAGTLRTRASQSYDYGDPLRVSEMETVSVAVEAAADGAKLVVLYDVAL